MSRPVILASTSQTRIAMLASAGVAVEALGASVDEAAVKESLKAEGASVEDCAETLAELKALALSRRYPDALVIGADQMLACEGRWFDKPTDKAAARAQLLDLRGRKHQLVTAAAVLLGGQRIWHSIDKADLVMRPFSEAFLDDYLDRAGDAVLSSVGAYQLEGLGAQLFTQVKGDVFTILGLPLLPLLDFLREHGVLLR